MKLSRTYYRESGREMLSCSFSVCICTLYYALWIIVKACLAPLCTEQAKNYRRRTSSVVWRSGFVLRSAERTARSRGVELENGTRMTVTQWPRKNSTDRSCYLLDDHVSYNSSSLQGDIVLWQNVWLQWWNDTWAAATVQSECFWEAMTL